MTLGRRPWREELDIIDRTMKAISGITDPEDLVTVYWNGIGELIRIGDYVSTSRRGIEPPYYFITRSSRFTEDINPWTQRDRLPRLTGGLLGEIAFANAPVIINDLPARLTPSDPGHFYLQGYQALVALPQYDNGEALNMTCMLLATADELDPSLIPLLHWQSGLFGRGTQNLVLRNQLSAALEHLDRELQTVGEIQRSLLPSVLPDIPGFALAAHYLTSARAGGDYYDFFPLDHGRWGIFIADVSGHGTPAAVLMAITHAIAHAQPGTHTPPASLLSYLNDTLTRLYTRSGTFVTAFYAVLDPAARTLTYSTAGHNPPRLLRAADKPARVISLDGARALPLGIIEDQRFDEATITFSRGDTLLLYTDGITEAMAPIPAPTPQGHPAGARTTELFGERRLDAALLAHPCSTPAAAIEAVRAAVAAFNASAPAIDDQTLIALRCL